jgi:hypothetical protein
MSPEQARGKSIDRRTDIFSLGSILFELLFGRKVFLADNDLDLLEQVRTASIPLPSTVDPTVPLELEQLLLRALSPNPDSRFPTAEALQMALREFQFHHVSQRVGAQDLSDLLDELFPMRRKPLAPATVPKFRVATMGSFHLRPLGQPSVAHEEPTPVGQISPDLLRRTVEPSQEWIAELSPAPQLPEEPPAIPPDADVGPGGLAPEGAVPVKAAPVKAAPDVGWRRRVAGPPPQATATFTGHLHLLQLVTAIQLPLAEERAPALAAIDDDDDDDQGPPTRAASPAALAMVASPRVDDGGASTEESLPAPVPEPEPLPPLREPTPRPETSDMVPLPARFSRSAPRATESTAPRRSWISWLLVALLGSALGSGVAFLLIWPRGDPAKSIDERSDTRVAPRSDSQPSPPDARPVPRDTSVASGQAHDAAAAAPPDDKPRAKGRRKSRGKSKPKASLLGQVVIKSEPWAYISVDGKSTGLTTSATPFRLPVGTHHVELVNPKLNLRQTLTIMVPSEGVSRTFVRLGE